MWTDLGAIAGEMSAALSQPLTPSKPLAPPRPSPSVIERLAVDRLIAILTNAKYNVRLRAP